VGLIDEIGPGPIGLDTSIFIYAIERHPRWVGILRPLFEAIDAGRICAATSALTLLEVLVVPYRLGDMALARRYEELLSAGRGMALVPVDLPILRGAAMIRAKTAAGTADAIQVAAAAAAGCTVFLTNDRRLDAGDVIRVLQLADYPSA
jgi:predicted nucleic acid-binding protein